MKALWFACSLSIGIVSAILPGHAQTLKLTAGHGSTEESHSHTALATIGKIVKERTNGEIDITIFPANQLGGEVRMAQSLRTGTLDLAVIGEAVLSSFISDYTVFSFPYLFRDGDHADDVLQGPIGDELLELLEPHGIKGLGYIASLERNFFTNGRIVRSASDMSGLKIRVIQGPGYVKAYEALGAQPTPMAFTELYVALQTGSVDAAENSPDIFLTYRFDEVSKTFVLSKIHYFAMFLLVSKSRWDSLTPEQQKIFTEAGEEAITIANKQYKKDYAESLRQIAEKNIEIIEPDLESFRATAPAVHKELLEQFPSSRTWYEKIIETR